MTTDYTDRYFIYCEFQKNLDEKTLKAYRIDLKQMAEYFALSKEDVSRETLERYIEQLTEKHKPATVKRKYAAMQAYFRFLVYEDILESSPMDKIKLKLRQEVALPRVIEKKALAQLLSLAYSSFTESKTPVARFAALRNVAVLELLFASGLRVSELCHITVDKLNLDEQYVRIMGKGSRERVIYLSNKQVVDILIRYKVARQSLHPETEYFFINRDKKRLTEQSVRGIINKYTKMVNNSGHYTPHMFRHSFATYLWDNCGDIYEVKNILGHSSIKTTERYVHASIQRQRQVLSTWHPRNELQVDI